ncbi:MAG: hypothetical protein M1831_006101 [Alyxoria varia]|nr:MAG: hypothetical protein M1831_006101 [Alyxoria varia]
MHSYFPDSNVPTLPSYVHGGMKPNFEPDPEQPLYIDRVRPRPESLFGDGGGSYDLCDRPVAKKEEDDAPAILDGITVPMRSFWFAENKYETLIKVVEAAFEGRDGFTVGSPLLKMRAQFAHATHGIEPEINEDNLADAIQIMCRESIKISKVVFDYEREEYSFWARRAQFLHKIKPIMEQRKAERDQRRAKQRLAFTAVQAHKTLR